MKSSCPQAAIVKHYTLDPLEKRREEKTSKAISIKA